MGKKEVQSIISKAEEQLKTLHFELESYFELNAEVKMDLLPSFFLVLLMFATSQSAILERDALQERGLISHVVDAHSGMLMNAFDAVASGLDELGINFLAFGSSFQPICQHFNEKYVKALIPMLEATPAETLKELMINILKALKSTMDEVAEVLVERNPLHPEKSPYDDPELFGRALMHHIRRQMDSEIMTLGIWGSYVGKAIEALDTFIVNFVITISNAIKEAEMQVDDGIKQVEAVPAEIVKTMLLEGLKGNMRG